MSQEIDKRVQVMADIGRRLLAQGTSADRPNTSLTPLGLVLLQLYDLFQVFAAGTEGDIAQLFDASESQTPNIYTRLQAIYGLCIASGYPVKWRAGSLDDRERPTEVEVSPPFALGEKWWRDRMGRVLDTRDDRPCTESALLLADVVEAGVLIAEAIRTIWEQPSLERGLWWEVYRHIYHIRLHYECAEEFLLDCLRPAS